MKRLTINEAEYLAQILREQIGLSLSEPASVKTVLRKLDILTMYCPLSEDAYGMSIKSPSGKGFVMVNSNSARGRQHFTVAHELYHLYFDPDPKPHMCNNSMEGEERNANMFAEAFLMPRAGIYKLLTREGVRGDIDIAQILRLEQYFEVSRSSLLIRLRKMDLISEQRYTQLKDMKVKETARAYGYDLSLYEPGNKGVVIGDFGEKARLLFEQEKISEGHYMELINMIQHGDEED